LELIGLNYPLQTYLKTHRKTAVLGIEFNTAFSQPLYGAGLYEPYEG